MLMVKCGYSGGMDTSNHRDLMCRFARIKQSEDVIALSWGERFHIDLGGIGVDWGLLFILNMN